MAKKKKEYIEEELIYECPACGKRFASIQAVNGHLRFGHKFSSEQIREMLSHILPTMPVPILPLEQIQEDSSAIEKVTPSIIPLQGIESHVKNKCSKISKEIKEKVDNANIENVIVRSDKKHAVPKRETKSIITQPISVESIQVNNKKEEEMTNEDISQLLKGVVDELSKSFNITPKPTEEDRRKRLEERERSLDQREIQFRRRISEDNNLPRNPQNNVDEQRKVPLITKKVEEVAVAMPKVIGAVAAIQEEQKALSDVIVKLSEKMPDNFCETYPDLCKRMSVIEEVMKDSVLPIGIDAAKARIDSLYDCPTCKKAIVEKAKANLGDIVGDDKKVITELAKKQGLRVIDPKDKFFG
ncbi:MAG: C2H2-type zinc finger protein [bacterium]|nr:C2H2-type zinc finger protein [bacterium]